MKLWGNTVLITGASSGMGLAFAITGEFALGLRADRDRAATVRGLVGG